MPCASPDFNRLAPVSRQPGKHASQQAESLERRIRVLGEMGPLDFLVFCYPPWNFLYIIEALMIDVIILLTTKYIFSFKDIIRMSWLCC